MLNGFIKPKIFNIYDPDTIRVAENENKYLVYILKCITDFVNDKVNITNTY
jgi:hypothetical protein